MEEFSRDLSPEQIARLLPLQLESPPAAAPLVIDAALVRHWSEAFEDAAALDGVSVPLGAILSTFALPYRWPAGTGERNLHFEVKEILGYPSAIISQIEVEQPGSAHIGDGLQISQRLLSVSARRQSRLGSGRFWTFERLYRRGDGELVALQRMTAFGYGEPPVDAPGRGAVQPLVEQRIGSIAGVAAAVPKEEIVVGTVLPELCVPVTLLRCLYVASASRDFGPQHCDAEYAAETRAGKVFVSSPFLIGMVGRHLTDWAGPRVKIARLTLALDRSIHVGDEMRIGGRVTVVRAEQIELEITISVGTEVAVRGTASLRV